MKPKYDFSKAERGKFYRPEAKFNTPIYLDQEVLDYFSQRAEAKGVDLKDMVNELLKKDISMIEGVS
jgi:hypothetical protein